MSRGARFACRLLPLALAMALTACALRAQEQSASTPGPGPVASRRGPEQLGPQLMVGRDGALYLFWMAIEPRTRWEILFSRSDDQGATWQPSPVSLKPDKETMARGVAVATDSQGNLYAVWRQEEPGHRRILLARSRDGGRRWDPLQEVASSPTIGLPRLVVDSEGGVSVAWLEGPAKKRHLEWTTSRDAGETFAAEQTRLSPTLASSKSGMVNLRIAADGAGHVYVVWEEDTEQEGKSSIYLRRSSDNGRTWAAESNLVSSSERTPFGVHNARIVAIRGGRVAVMWEQFQHRALKQPGGGSLTRVDRILCVNRSVDGGQTWLAKPTCFDTIDPAAHRAVRSGHAQLSADQDGHLYAAWVKANGPTPTRLLFTHSPDFGETWDSQQIRLESTSPLSAPPFAPILRHDDSGHVWILWQERANLPDGWQILINRSDDYGRTWRRRAVRLTGPEGRLGTIRRTTFHQANGRLFAAWDDGRRSAGGIMSTRSADAGRTWLPHPVRVDRP